ncbi:sigma-70 family RNA polymerase sigma factor [Roseibacillus persicicus]|uniref:DNA-directed RNA polymerase sigma-70 factor n=1 Tax=Roseibacillus persicicus TaxID=454148 RepID=A0A918TNX4_9BACT|nr:DNA-directed RNA polymerase sigma-70 factor [Roseibacillus persicicus]
MTLLTGNQSQLLGYIMASVANSNDSQDILQKTNIQLWRNHESYDSSRPFLPWALTLARFQILSFYRDRQRDRLIFDADVLESLQTVTEERIQSVPRRQEALRSCLVKLKDEQRTILSLYYAHRKSIEQISLSCNRSIDGVKSLLLRIRKNLKECIDTRMNTSPESQS